MSNKSKSITLNFLLPLLGKPVKTYRPSIKDAFLADEARFPYVSGRIFVLMDASTPSELVHSMKSNVAFMTSYDISEFETMYVFQLAGNLKADYDLIIEGKYSRISDFAKKLILSGAKPDSINAKVLSRAPDLRKIWEDKLGVTLTSEDEVYSKIAIEDEFYTTVREGETSS
jgi:hypothetical protein